MTPELLLAIPVWTVATFWQLSSPRPNSYYEEKRPRQCWWPSSLVFAGVWTVLYSLLSLFIVLYWYRGPRDTWLYTFTVSLYLVNIALNKLWTPIFFSDPARQGTESAGDAAQQGTESAGNAARQGTPSTGDAAQQNTESAGNTTQQNTPNTKKTEKSAVARRAMLFSGGALCVLIGIAFTAILLVIVAAISVEPFLAKAAVISLLSPYLAWLGVALLLNSIMLVRYWQAYNKLKPDSRLPTTQSPTEESEPFLPSGQQYSARVPPSMYRRRIIT